EARASDLRARTRRANDTHQAKMADRRATTQIRLMAIDVAYYALMVSGVVVIVGSGFAITWLVIGGSIGLVQRVNVHRIRLDSVTKQYDALLYGPASERRLLNPNTGEQRRLSETSVADRRRIEATAKVQIAGLLADHTGIERGWIDEIQT
ncbi:hypothetical protein LCGC14_1701620, partial [marine sediment metagenome]